MPKVPRANGKGGRRSKAAAGSRAPKGASGNGSRRPRRASPKKSGNGGPGGKRAATTVAEPTFQHRGVDRAPEHEPAGPKSRLTDDQRVLLGDLFAVVEEHSSDA